MLCQRILIRQIQIRLSKVLSIVAHKNNDVAINVRHKLKIQVTLTLLFLLLFKTQFLASKIISTKMDFLATRINTSLELGHVIRNDTFGKQHLIEQFSTNRNIKDPAYHILIILYSALIILGASGNALVVLAIIRNKQMRTARNMFIVNLAISGN